MIVKPTFRITSSGEYVMNRRPLVLYADTRQAAIEALKESVYAMIKANARLDTKTGHRVMSQCLNAEKSDNMTVRLLGDYVHFEKMPTGFTP